MRIEIQIDISLIKEIKKKFGKKEALRILNSFEKLKENPKKGKKVGKVGEYLIKELKYESFRFYFITNGVHLRLFLKEEIENLLIKFVKMSKKNNQEEIIEEIKSIIKKLYFNN